MRSHSASSTGVAPDPTSLGWLIAIPLGCLVLIQVLLVLTGIVPVLDGSLADSDAYMRLARVAHLHDGGAWFDAREPRINPPVGHVQHWTRPLDALLLAGAWVLEPVLGFARSLHLWGVLISPALLALALGALAWAAVPALDREARLLACLVLLTQPTVLAYTSVGRPDHHSLLLLLALLLIGLTARLAATPGNRRAALLAGAIAALGIWVSPEALTFVGVSLAALGLFWLWGTPGLARANRDYLLTSAVMLGAALLVERGPADLLALESDRLSIVHVALFALLAGFWVIISRAERARVGGAFGRALAAAAGVTTILVLMLLLFPDLRQGPLGQVDPLYARVRLQNVIEAQPLMPAEWLGAGRIAEAFQRPIRVIGIVLFALPCLAVLLARSSGAAWRFWATVALAVLTFLALAFYQLRWATYAEAFVVWPYAAGISWLLSRITRAAKFGVLMRPLIVLAALLWPLLLAAALPQQEIELAGRACPLDRLATVLNRVPEPQTVLAYADYGAELLYRTPHRVLSIPNHRPQPGFAATWRILTATEERVARAEVARSGVDLILLCPSATERALFAVPQLRQPTLYQRLVDGQPPPWLRPVPLDADAAAAARLFEVVRPGDRLVATTGGAG